MIETAFRCINKVCQYRELGWAVFFLGWMVFGVHNAFGVFPGNAVAMGAYGVALAAANLTFGALVGAAVATTRNYSYRISPNQEALRELGLEHKWAEAPLMGFILAFGLLALSFTQSGLGLLGTVWIAVGASVKGWDRRKDYK